MTELFINGVQVDMIEDFPVSLNYSINDVRNFDQRNTAYTKTIVLPGSPTNNKLFSGIYDFSRYITTVDFNPSQKAEARLYVNGELMIDGFARMLRVINKDGAVTYEICIYDNTANLFKSVGDDLVNTLDISDITHDWTVTNIVNSWSSGDYYYPLTFYGDNNINRFNVNSIFPAVRLKKVWDAIMLKYGFSYTSDFFDTDFFKSIFLLSSSTAPLFSDAVLETFRVKASYSSSMGLIPTRTLVKLKPDNDATGGNQDPQGWFNNDGDLITNRSLQCNVVVGIPYTFTRGTEDISKDVVIEFACILRVNATTSSSVNVRQTFTIPASSTSISGTLVAQFNNQQILSLGSTKPTFVDISYRTSAINDLGQYVNSDSTLTVGLANIEYKFLSRQILEGEPLDPSQYLPNIKIKDFMKSIIQMFNLYIDTKKVTGQLLIEPRDDYYAQGTKKDWTDKLDRSSDIETLPMAELSYRQLKLTYTPDNDFQNDLHTRVYGRVYGDKVQDISTDFNESINVVQPVFAPTIVGDVDLLGRLLPMIYKEENGVKSRLNSFKPRVLMRTPVISCPSYKIRTGTFPTHTDTTLTTYSPAMMVNKYLNPDESIEFGMPAEVRYSLPGSYTNNNLYNRFYTKQVGNVASPSSILVKAKFYLTARDIATFNYYDTIQVDGVDFKVNKIIDFNPIEEGLCTVELLKDVFVNDFVESEVVIPDNPTPEPSEFDVLEGGEDTVNEFASVYDGGEDSSNELGELIYG